MSTKDTFYNVSIISAFPGMGKSYCAAENEKHPVANIFDMESSDYHWIQDTPESKKELDSRWPDNYISAIITKAVLLCTGQDVKGGIIFISSHNEVIEGLSKIFNDIQNSIESNGSPINSSAFFLYKEHYISFGVAVPSSNRLEEFVKFYRQRGNTEEFIEKLRTNWQNFIDDASSHKYCDAYVIHKGHIGDYLAPYMSVKYGDKDHHNVILTMGNNTYDEISFINLINKPLFDSIHTYTVNERFSYNLRQFKLMIKNRNRLEDKSRYLYIVELVDGDAASKFVDMISDDETYATIYNSCNFTYV